MFDAGEGLLLKISGHEMRLAEWPALRGMGRADSANKGTCTLHYGGEMESYLEVPVMDM